MAANDRTLKRWYNAANRDFFDGLLPTDVVIRWEPVARGDADCDFVDGKFLIRINPTLMGRTEAAHFAVKHEMVHVKLWPNKSHGKKFQIEMKSLAVRDAFEGLW